MDRIVVPALLSCHPMSYWLENLNPEQKEAVLHDHGPLLILAGAGSGKTTVLVSRTGRLIAEKLTTPERVCVLTFTNKAATELKHRVAKKLGAKAEKVWAGTFHGFGLQFLKEHWKEADLPNDLALSTAATHSRCSKICSRSISRTKKSVLISKHS